MLSWLALIFLTLTGYSAGAVLGYQTIAPKGKSDLSPSLIDMMIVVVLWIGGIISRVSGLGSWLVVGIWLVLAGIVGFFLNVVQPRIDEGKALPQ